MHKRILNTERHVVAGAERPDEEQSNAKQSVIAKYTEPVLSDSTIRVEFGRLLSAVNTMAAGNLVTAHIPVDAIDLISDALAAIKAALQDSGALPRTGEGYNLPTEPGAVVLWWDGAYLPQVAILDPHPDHGGGSLGWHYENPDEVGGRWLTTEQLAEAIGDAQWVRFVPSGPLPEEATRPWVRLDTLEAVPPIRGEA